MPAGAQAPDRVTLAGQAKESDEVCSNTIGQGELFKHCKANPPKGVNPDRKSGPNRFCAEGW